MISLLPIGEFETLLQRQAFSWPWSKSTPTFSPERYKKASRAILKDLKDISWNLAQELGLNADQEIFLLKVFKKRANQVEGKHPSLNTTRLTQALNTQQKTGPKELLSIATTFKQQPKVVKTQSTKSARAGIEFSTPWLRGLVKKPVSPDSVIAVLELNKVYTQLRSLWYFTEILSVRVGDALRETGEQWGVLLGPESDTVFLMQDGSTRTLQGSGDLCKALMEGPYSYGSSHLHGDPSKKAIAQAMSDLEGQARKTS